jgi:DNA-nicking Smr family endonuclease
MKFIMDNACPVALECAHVIFLGSMGKKEENGSSEPVGIPIDGILDLHTFHPADLKELLPDYLDECREKGIYEVRVIHGKGTGALRKSVHSILRKLPYVVSFVQAGEEEGGWGATLVALKPEDR